MVSIQLKKNTTMKKVGILVWMALACMPTLFAQQKESMADSVQATRQLSLSEFDRVEPTESEKHVIVYKDSLCGIYDVKSLRNVTDMAYTSIRVRNRRMSELGPVTVFVYRCGERRGLISLFEENNEYVILDLGTP